MRAWASLFIIALSSTAFADAVCVSTEAILTEAMPTKKYFYSTNKVDLTSAKYSIFITNKLDERQYTSAKSYVTTDPVAGLRANHRVFITDDKINAVRVSKNIFLTANHSARSWTQGCMFATQDVELADDVKRRVLVLRLKGNEIVNGMLYFVTTDPVQGITADIIVYSSAPYKTFKSFLNLDVSNPVVPFVLW